MKTESKLPTYNWTVVSFNIRLAMSSWCLELCLLLGFHTLFAFLVRALCWLNLDDWELDGTLLLISFTARGECTIIARLAILLFIDFRFELYYPR